MDGVRLAGLALVALCAAGTGFMMSLALTDRVKALELARTVLESFTAELSYSLSPPDAIVSGLAGRETLEKAGYLGECRVLCGRGIPFPEAWRESVRKASGALAPGDREILAALSDTLGRCGLEEALGALNRANDALAVALEEARDYARTHGKLYRTLGALTGVFFVILWI